MGVFYFLVLIPIMIQHITVNRYHIGYEKRNKRAIACFFFVLTILLMFRHQSIGNDTRNYIYYFEKISRMGWLEVSSGGMEVGYSYFNKIISLISMEPRILISITAILINIMIYPTYKRLCVDSALTIVLFCTMSTFVVMFSGIRQMIAVAIGFVAYEFTRDRKVVCFIVSICVAIMFHNSAFMLIFMYPIYHVRLKRKHLFIVVPTLIAIGIFNRSIFTFLANILEHFTKYDTTISATGAYTMFFLFIVFTVFSFIIPDERKMDDEAIGMRNFLLLAVVIQMFAPLHSLAMRMNYYYIIFIPLLIPRIIFFRNKIWNKVAIWGRHAMFCFFLLYFFVNAYTSNNNLHVFPYHFFGEVV